MIKFFPERARLKHLLIIASPMILSMVSENLIGLVDGLMVGRLGTAQLAAVGVGGFVYFLSLAALLGMISGVQTVAAWRFGEKRFSELGEVLNAGLLICFAIGIPLYLVFSYFAPQIIGFITHDPAVVQEAIAFFRWRVVGILFLCVTFAFQGYWNGISKGHYFLGMLAIGHASNAFLNYCFIFGKFGFPAFGIAGAGMASSAALVLGVIYCFAFGMKEEISKGFLKVWPSLHTVKEILRVAIPTSVERIFLAIAVNLNYKIAALMGTAAVAGSYVIIQLLLLAVLPAIGFGTAATTLVGQSLGEDNPEEADRWAWDTAKIASLYGMIVGIVVFIFAKPLVGFFIQDAAIQAITIPALRVYCLVMWLESLARSLMGAMTGAGDSITAMIYSSAGLYFAFLPLCYVLGPYLGGGLVGSWCGDAIYQLIFAGMFVYLWKRGNWRTKKQDIELTP